MSTVSIETNLERIAIALERLADQGSREVQLDLPIIEKEEEPKESLKDALIETSKPKVEAEKEVSEMSRDAIKAALDEMDIKYNNRTSTSNLYKVFLKAESELKSDDAPVVEEKKEEVVEEKKEEVVEEEGLSFEALKGVLSDFSKQSTDNATKVKDLIKAFGPSAKLSTLSEAQKKELLFNFQEINKSNNADSFLG